MLPHDGDNFLLEKNTRIILRASQEVDWFVNNKFFGRGQEQIFVHQSPGQYQIKAQFPTVQEEVSISVLGE